MTYIPHPDQILLAPSNLSLQDWIILKNDDKEEIESVHFSFIIHCFLKVRNGWWMAMQEGGTYELKMWKTCFLN